MDELGLTKPPHSLSVSEVMQRNVTVQVIPDTFIIQITARLTDPALAAGLANRMAERAVEASRRASQDDIVTARDTIKLQLDESRARLEEAEKKIETYRKEAHLEALQKEVDAMLEQRSRLLALTVVIEAERARVKQTTEELARQKPVRDYQRSLAPAANSEVTLRENLTDPYANPVYEVLEQRLTAARTSLAGLEREHAEISRATSLSAAGAKKLNELYVRKAEIERLQSELELARKRVRRRIEPLRGGATAGGDAQRAGSGDRQGRATDATDFAQSPEGHRRGDRVVARRRKWRHSAPGRCRTRTLAKGLTSRSRRRFSAASLSQPSIRAPLPATAVCGRSD